MAEIKPPKGNDKLHHYQINPDLFLEQRLNHFNLAFVAFAHKGFWPTVMLIPCRLR